MEIDDEDPQWIVVDRLGMIARVGGPAAIIMAAIMIVSLLWWMH